MDALRTQIIDSAMDAKQASVEMGKLSEVVRNDALVKMAHALRENANAIIAANEKDVESARREGVKDSLIDRLELNEERIESMAAALEDLVALPDPIGKTLFEDTLYNGIKLSRVSTALGVVAVIYEARPNVTADAVGICIKSGNSCVLRGGSLAFHSNQAIVDVLKAAGSKAGIPEGAIQLIASKDRAATDILMQLHGIIDVLIPRGGQGLIEHCVNNSKVPVIETGTGNCHVYVHESADIDMARDIVKNSKCRRYGVCNACETLLLDENISDADALLVIKPLVDEGVVVHADKRCADILRADNIAYVDATEKDWETEYLSPDIAIKFVDGVESAIEHVNKYSTKHSESIVASDIDVAEKFLNEIDAAAVYHNAATAFTDGGQFGLGAEIGISTQKIHVRGPFAIEALTTYKYLLRGDGQTRS